MAIVRDENILGGDPRIEGTRIGVLHIYELVVDGDHPPADIADQLDLSLGQVYEALAYYYNHPDEMRSVASHHAAAEETLAKQALAPPEPAR
jgi:uncharacterized protein (DUF433 family)